MEANALYNQFHSTLSGLIDKKRTTSHQTCQGNVHSRMGKQKRNSGLRDQVFG